MSSLSSSTTSTPHRLLARFPSEIQAAHDTYLTTKAFAAADQVLIAVLLEHMPKEQKEAQGSQPIPDEARLMEDLGFDSLAVAEVVVFVEDHYQVRDPQDRLLEMRKVGDLRAYLRQQLQMATA